MEVSVFSRSDGHVGYVGPVISAVFAEISQPPIVPATRFLRCVHDAPLIDQVIENGKQVYRDQARRRAASGAEEAELRRKVHHLDTKA